MKRRPSASPEAPVSRIYEVSNAETLRDLCGPHHRHLQLLETRLDEYGLKAESQGGGILLVGKAEGVSIAEAVLAELERRLRKGADISDMDVDGALEAARTPQQTFGTFRSLKKPITPQTRGQSRYIDLLANPDNAMIFGVGPAGTGKTFLAVAAGVSELLSGARQRLIVTRPAVEAGEKLGFLPGTLEEKVDPYMLPIWDSLRELMGQEQMERRMARGEIEVAPLAFMRGRTLKNAFVIVDEAQNTTIPQMKMVLTRLGRDSRMVITGDPGQVDLPGSQPSGMRHALEILSDVEGVNVHKLTAADVVRHGLVSRIIDAYAAHGEG
ncbi:MULTISPECIES: PhoH family protein [Hyphomonas]|uniref:PhoH family protein n=1 Tax=Hyphomonas TaxID=85 RepID=UPI000B670A91|nr:PhoH family protein [Hyphomonas atlantica]MAH91553.1 phosphate starvation-inducible protein PhoH [Hyphomonas sp.]OUX85203.1 MAG: phosphate starvation-inducible protein PhoH [Hyphomonas sp. TMED31]MAH93463.1 phosphate starvation-inducible protein PhoH [Hyphomonas sp.]MAM06022.1 phosphate starvation-inducible protein PhoH [Hyphomonas sp.]HBH44799.1 phosphate starvation-inducible protein PhoH [Hyphomonas atlantica]